MFNSKFSQRLFKWLFSPKKYIVNIEFQLFDKYSLMNVEVIAHTKNEAMLKAVEKVKQEQKNIVSGLRSLGKIKTLQEF